MQRGVEGRFGVSLRVVTETFCDLSVLSVLVCQELTFRIEVHRFTRRRGGRRERGRCYWVIGSAIVLALTRNYAK